MCGFLKSIFFVSTLSCVVFAACGQNSMYKIIHDSIYPNLEQNFPFAKKQFVKHYESNLFDPGETAFFCYFLLENDEIKLYKRVVKHLSKNFGWGISFVYPSLVKNTSAEFLISKIYQKGLYNWTLNATKKNEIKWIAKNPKKHEIGNRITILFNSDQFLRKVLMNFNKSNDFIDSDIEAKVLFGDDRILTELIGLSVENDSLLPNNFDNGVGISGKVQIIILHNLKNDHFLDNWNLLLPFIEKTYFAGRISSSIFKAYDIAHEIHFGTQYFGTLDMNIPIKDMSTLKERRLKYAL
jgi:hypothetical protein